MTFDLSKISIKMPSPEEMAELERSRVDASKKNKNAFMYWYPEVLKANINSPRTKISLFPLLASKRFIGANLTETEIIEADSAINKVVESIKLAGKEFGYPIFIKSSLTSAKHDWADSCFIGSEDDNIVKKLGTIIIFQAMHMPDYSFQIIIREFIKTEPAFYAFNNMPVTEEYRVFAKDGVMLGWQPYWPEMSIVNPSIEDWKDRLKAISTPSDEDISEMTRYANSITKSLGGYWSVDFLKDKNGKLWLIDMAEGDKSFKCKTGYIAV